MLRVFSAVDICLFVVWRYMMATTIGMGVLCNAMIRPLSKNDKSKV